MKNYKVFGDRITLDEASKQMIINEHKISFEKMEEYNKAYRGVNKIHKPSALLIYIDYKNNKLKDWSCCEC